MQFLTFNRNIALKYKSPVPAIITHYLIRAEAQQLYTVEHDDIMYMDLTLKDIAVNINCIRPALIKKYFEIILADALITEKNINKKMYLKVNPNNKSIETFYKEHTLGKQYYDGKDKKSFKSILFYHFSQRAAKQVGLDNAIAINRLAHILVTATANNHVFEYDGVLKAPVIKLSTQILRTELPWADTRYTLRQLVTRQFLLVSPAFKGFYALNIPKVIGLIAKKSDKIDKLMGITQEEFKTILLGELPITEVNMTNNMCSDNTKHITGMNIAYPKCKCLNLHDDTTRVAVENGQTYQAKEKRDTELVRKSSSFVSALGDKVTGTEEKKVEALLLYKERESREEEERKNILTYISFKAEKFFLNFSEKLFKQTHLKKTARRKEFKIKNFNIFSLQENYKIFKNFSKYKYNTILQNYLKDFPPTPLPPAPRHHGWIEAWLKPVVFEGLQEGITYCLAADPYRPEFPRGCQSLKFIYASLLPMGDVEYTLMQRRAPRMSQARRMVDLEERKRFVLGLLSLQHPLAQIELLRQYDLYIGKREELTHDFILKGLTDLLMGKMTLPAIRDNSLPLSELYDLPEADRFMLLDVTDMLYLSRKAISRIGERFCVLTFIPEETTLDELPEFTRQMRDDKACCEKVISAVLDS